MGSEAIKNYGAAGRFDGLWFDPDKLHIETDDSYELYDERVKLKLDEAMVENIMAFGVLQPITINRVGRNGETVAVVDGRQRVRHAREANRRLKAAGKVPVRVPAVVAKSTDLLGVMISANGHRFDETPMGRARKYLRYLGTGHSEDEAQIAYGVSRETLRQWRILLELHPDVQKAIDARELPGHVALKLREVPYEEQPGALAVMREAGELRGQAGEKAARGASGKKPAGATKLSLRITPTELRTFRRTLEGAEFKGISAKARKTIDDLLERIIALEKRARGGPKP